jgi:NAD(P)-dependent dehydrogenase (short-subunit alcohol dehydrogenase family)
MSKVAMIVGAGSGVGRAVTLELARRGWSAALVGRHARTLQETIALAGEVNGKLAAYVCDVADAAAVSATVARAARTLGEIETLVFSAGINVARRALSELSLDDYRRVVDVNLNGAFNCVHALLPRMRQRGAGTIVNIISDAGLWANQVSGAAYIASKFGLTGLTATINVEERAHGIRACAILPGEINTPLLDRRPVVPTAAARAKMLQPEDVAACVMLAIELPHRAVIEQLVVRPR